jgi:hypothetical protein
MLATIGTARTVDSWTASHTPGQGRWSPSAAHRVLYGSALRSRNRTGTAPGGLPCARRRGRRTFSRWVGTSWMLLPSSSPGSCRISAETRPGSAGSPSWAITISGRVPRGRRDARERGNPSIEQPECQVGPPLGTGLDLRSGRSLHGCPDPDSAFKVADGVRIVLMHSLSGLLDIGSRPFDLALCGHTHGGQVAMHGGIPIYVPGGYSVVDTGVAGLSSPAGARYS